MTKIPFQPLKNLFESNSRQSIVFESICCLIVGGGVGALFTEHRFTTFQIIIFVGASALYVWLICTRVRSLNFIPSNVIDNLKATIELEDLNKQLARRDTISKFITDSITALNEQTCAIAKKKEQGICSQAVSIGLEKVIAPLIQFPQNLFDCKESCFTIVAKVRYLVTPPDERTSYFLIFRDDFEIKNIFPEDLLDRTSVKNSMLEAQHAIQRSLSENKLIYKDFTHNDNELSMTVSPIPTVCEADETNGALIFITHNGHNRPSDMDNTLRIFGRIIANWLDKYSECVAAKAEKKVG